ncbi:hypothetical protein [Spirochaeta cellobiosiphila]|uniref:hypothetical protein n=1 Tax=Spirochaeta cellobiosiphila TaxID=504483 RepID=UPI00042894E4|nr:hypothetical protein [Spirochaeta cellobiosiphila]
MKKILVLAFLSSLLFSCASTPPLDLSTLENKEFHLTGISVVVTEEVDEGKQGQKFFDEQIPNILDIVQKHLLENYDVDLNATDYEDLQKAGNVDINFREIELKMIIHHYFWDNTKKYDQKASLSIPLAFDENNSMNVSVYLTDAEGKSLNVTVPLQVQTAE